jgi:hypothetical protein
MPYRSCRLCVVVVAAVAWSAAASAQSLAEIARKEKDRRTKVASPAKVYTNADLKNLPPLPDPPPPPPPPAGAPGVNEPLPASGAAKPEPDKEAKGETYWRGRISAVRAALEQAELTHSALQNRVDMLATDFVNRDDPAQKAVIAQERQQALVGFEKARLEIQRLKKEISDIETEARRANVPPGWLR